MVDELRVTIKCRDAVTAYFTFSSQMRPGLHEFRMFLASDFHMESGKKYLIEAFYRSIIDKTPPPISYREILLTARIMDAVFQQLSQGSRPAISPASPALAPQAA